MMRTLGLILILIGLAAAALGILAWSRWSARSALSHITECTFMLSLGRRLPPTPSM
jgi:uncharacterized membrane protein YidH (DUF202 family)